MSNVDYPGGLGFNQQFGDRWSDNLESNSANKWDIFRSPDYKIFMYKSTDGIFKSALRTPALGLSTLIVVNNTLVQFIKTISGI